MTWVRPCLLVSPQTAGASGSAGVLRQGVLDGPAGRPLAGGGYLPAATANHVPRLVRTPGGWSHPETRPGFNLPAAGRGRASGARNAGRAVLRVVGCARAFETDARLRSVCFTSVGWKSAPAGEARSRENRRPSGLTERVRRDPRPCRGWSGGRWLWLEGGRGCRVKS